MKNYFLVPIEVSHLEGDYLQGILIWSSKLFRETGHEYLCHDLVFRKGGQ